MLDRVTVFDVETPNLQHNRICALGLVFIENGKIARSEYFLIDPECEFDARNSSIHGITPEMTVGAMNFPQLWSELLPYFSESVLCAHNAGFDISVLKKTCAAYNIDFSTPEYIDTMPLIYQFWSDIPNRKLSTVCEWLGIPLEHHNPASDAMATAQIFLKMMDKGLDASTTQTHLTADSCSHLRHNAKKSRENCQIQELRQLMAEIVFDGEIRQAEYRQLCSWLFWRSDLAGTYPYDDLFDSIMKLEIEDNPDSLALSELERLCVSLLDPVNFYSCNCSGLTIAGKNIVLTGDFVRGSREQISEELTNYGANIQKSVTQKTDYLLVGSCGSDAWSNGNYGNKVKRALELQKKGLCIQIFKEADFFLDLQRTGKTMTTEN